MPINQCNQLNQLNQLNEQNDINQLNDINDLNHPNDPNDLNDPNDPNHLPPSVDVQQMGSQIDFFIFDADFSPDIFSVSVHGF